MAITAPSALAIKSYIEPDRQGKKNCIISIKMPKLTENKKAKYHFKKVKMEYRLKGITTENIKEKVNGKKLLENDRDFYKTFLTYPLIEKRGKVN